MLIDRMTNILAKMKTATMLDMAVILTVMIAAILVDGLTAISVTV